MLQSEAKLELFITCADKYTFATHSRRGDRQSLLKFKPLCSLGLYDLVINMCCMYVSMEQDIKLKHKL